MKTAAVLKTAVTKPGTAKSDAASLLKADHRKVEQLFAHFEQTEEAGKEQLVHQICLELIIHTRLEEEIFYPACREKHAEDDMLDEAQVEHDGAKVLIGDLLNARPGERYFDAKVKTLSQYIKHHVAEEEKPRSGILAKAQKAGVDMNGLGEKLQARKAELMAESESMISNPPQPRSFRLQPQKETSMPRYSNDCDRDERGRFTEEDDDRGGRRGGYQSRSGGPGRDEESRFTSEGNRGGGGRGHGGWSGDPEGHSRASREGWEDRGSSRSRSYDDDDRRSGRGHGGWSGDPEGHSQASREGWRHSSHEGSGWYGDPQGHSQASREGWRHSSHEGSGWYGDPEAHSQASREGWEDRGRYSGRQSGRGRDDDDDYRSGRGHGGWSGDPEGHSQAAREGWRNR